MSYGNSNCDIEDTYCPVCHAKAGERCITRTKRRLPWSKSHVARWNGTWGV